MTHERPAAPHVIDLVLAQCTRTPDAVALSGRSRLTYRDLATQVEETAANLAAAGLTPGDRVLFSIRPCIEGIVLVLGILRAGGVVVFVDPGSTPELFAARLAAAAPTWAATESLLYAISQGPLRRLARSRGLLLPSYSRLDVEHVYSGRWLPGVPRGARSARSLTRPVGRGLGAGIPGASATAAAPAPLDGDAHALTVFTSGTTSAPKAVVHTGASLAAASELLRGVNALTPGQDVFTDQMLLGVPALLAGATWTIPAVSPAKDITAFARGAAAASCAFLVPADVTALLDALEEGRVPASCASVVLVGGAPVTAALLARAVRLLPATRWLAVYGMTEILPVAVVEAGDKLAFDGDGDLVGAPLAGIAARIVAAAERGAGADDDAGSDDEAGSDEAGSGVAPTGELVLAGPSLMAGYLDDLGQSPRSAAEHHTGDLAYLDNFGRIVLVGRSRDMIIRGTVNIYPGLYEPRVAALDGVEAAVLVGVQQEDGDERVALVLTAERASGAPARPAASRTEAAGRLTDDHPLLTGVRARLPEILDHGALPDVVLLAERIPLAGRSRKPDRRALALAVAPVLRAGADPTC